MLHKPQPFRLQSRFPHGLYHIAQPLRPVADTQTSAVFQQPGGALAHILDGAGNFVPGDPFSLFRVHYTCANGFIRGIAGHQVHGTHRRFPLQKPQILLKDRHQLFLFIVFYRTAQQVRRLLLNFHRGNVGGRLFPKPDHGDGPAARSQLRHPLSFYREAKVRQENGVGSKMMGFID